MKESANEAEDHFANLLWEEYLKLGSSCRWDVVFDLSYFTLIIIQVGV